MLFDLESKGRRVTVKVIYSLLAILLAGGLIFFGIGGATGGGGLFDAFSEQQTVNPYSKKIEQAQKNIKLDPKDTQAWAELTRAQVQQASLNGYDENTQSYTAEGKAELEKASVSWQRYLEFKPKKIDGGLATLMVNAYGPGGLDDPIKAVQALKESIAARDPNSALYAQLAVLSYQAGNKREAKLAEEKAISLAPKDKRKALTAQIQGQKKQIDNFRKEQQKQQQAQPQGFGG